MNTNSNTNALGDRLKTLRKKRGLSQAELATRAGLAGQGAIGNIERGSRGYGVSVLEIARVLQTSPAFLLLETDDPAAAPNTNDVIDSPPPRAAAFSGAGGDLVPLVSWVQAGQWAEAVPVDPREVEEWLPCPVRHSPRTYALRVRGDSMTSPHGGRSYPEGSVIFVDPERRSPYSGQRVVALRTDSNEATFKTYKNEDGRQWLHPINPTYPTIFDPFEVLGIVIGAWMPE